jgi:hypothetical protein
MPRKKRNERLNLTVDETLKRQFEAICALKGLSMSDGIQEAIAGWLKQNASPELLAAIQNESDDEPPASPGKGE